MNDDDLDRTARALLEPAPMTVAERDAAWGDLMQRLETPARPRRRWRLLAVPAGAAVAATVAIALVPGGADAPLSTASAATVLLAAAGEADLGAPGPGEELFVQQRRTIPLGGGQTEVDLTRSWTAADGSIRIRGSEDEGWRDTLTPAQVQALPTDPAELLEALRAAVREASGNDRAMRVFGHDLGVVAVIYYLSTNAPVTAEQRAALLQLLATAPDWTAPGTSVTPLTTRNMGQDRSAQGDAVIRIRLELRFTAEEARELSVDPEPFALDLLIDTDAGRLVELREFEDGLSGAPIVTTIEEQKIVSARGA